MNIRRLLLLPVSVYQIAEAGVSAGAPAGGGAGAGGGARARAGGAGAGGGAEVGAGERTGGDPVRQPPSVSVDSMDRTGSGFVFQIQHVEAGVLCALSAYTDQGLVGYGLSGAGAFTSGLEAEHVTACMKWSSAIADSDLLQADAGDFPEMFVIADGSSVPSDITIVLRNGHSQPLIKYTYRVSSGTHPLLVTTESGPSSGGTGNPVDPVHVIYEGVGPHAIDQMQLANLYIQLARVWYRVDVLTKSPRLDDGGFVYSKGFSSVLVTHNGVTNKLYQGPPLGADRPLVSDSRTHPAPVIDPASLMGILQIRNADCRVMLLGVPAFLYPADKNLLTRVYGACRSPSISAVEHSVTLATLRFDEAAGKHRVDCEGGEGKPIGSYWVSHSEDWTNGPFAWNETDMGEGIHVIQWDRRTPGSGPKDDSILWRIRSICVNMELLHKFVTEDVLAINAGKWVTPSDNRVHLDNLVTYVKAGIPESLTFDGAPAQLLESIALQSGADGVLRPLTPLGIRPGPHVTLRKSDCWSAYVVGGVEPAELFAGDLNLALSVEGVPACAPRIPEVHPDLKGTRLKVNGGNQPVLHCLGDPIEESAVGSDSVLFIIAVMEADHWESMGTPNTVLVGEAMTTEAIEFCSGLFSLKHRVAGAVNDAREVALAGRAAVLFDGNRRLPDSVKFNPWRSRLYFPEFPERSTYLNYQFNDEHPTNRPWQPCTWESSDRTVNVWVTDRVLEMHVRYPWAVGKLTLESGASGVFDLMTTSSELFFKLYKEAFTHRRFAYFDKKDRSSQFIRGKWGYRVVNDGLGHKALQETPTGLLFRVSLIDSNDGSSRNPGYTPDFFQNRMKQIWFIMDQTRRYPENVADAVVGETHFRYAVGEEPRFLRISHGDYADTYWNIGLGTHPVNDLLQVIQSNHIGLPGPVPVPTEGRVQDGISINYYCSNFKHRILIACTLGDLAIHRARPYSGSDCTPLKSECDAMFHNQLLIQQVAHEAVLRPVIPPPTRSDRLRAWTGRVWNAAIRSVARVPTAGNGEYFEAANDIIRMNAHPGI